MKRLFLTCAIAISLLMVPISAAAALIWNDGFETDLLDEYDANDGVSRSQNRAYAGSWSALADNDAGVDQWGNSKLGLYVPYANPAAVSVRFYYESGMEGRLGNGIKQCMWSNSHQAYKERQFDAQVFIGRVLGINWGQLYVKNFFGTYVAIADPFIVSEGWHLIQVAQSGGDYLGVFFDGTTYENLGIKGYATGVDCDWNGTATVAGFNFNAQIEDPEYSGPRAGYFDNFRVSDNP